MPHADAPCGVPSETQALLGRGQVRHRRLRPRVHAFSYPTYFLMLPLRQLRRQPAPALPRNRWGLISFSDRDHGDGRSDCLAWLDELLQQEGILDAQGEVWLHCYPRVLGYTFKPVSFWYCHRVDNSLAAIVVEVNNTFGEKHCYLLHGEQLRYGQEYTAQKLFHVSPFCEVKGQYRFRFMRTAGERTVVRIDHDDGLGPLIQTSVSGQLQVLNSRSLFAAFFGMPLMTWGVIARIHWQALKLWAKRIPFVSKPPAPDVFVTR
ncbi:MAG: DUF1365 domain-containing protein [Burkholderiales bacterium]